MHYRNGREAKNGDRVVQLDSNGKVQAHGVLFDAKPGNDFCNGYIAHFQSPVTGACIIDCLHADDVAALLAERGLDQRPVPPEPEPVAQPEPVAAAPAPGEAAKDQPLATDAPSA